MVKKSAAVGVTGAALVLAFAAPAGAANKVQVSCSDGTGYSVGAAATFGQKTANSAFNAANPLGITCSVG